jgi:hypothetical protein
MKIIMSLLLLIQINIVYSKDVLGKESPLIIDKKSCFDGVFSSLKSYLHFINQNSDKANKKKTSLMPNIDTSTGKKHLSVIGFITMLMD